MNNISTLALPMLIQDLLDVPYCQTREHTFWGHLDPSRLSVPRYVCPTEDIIDAFKHTQVSEYIPYCCLAFLFGGLFAGRLALVLHFRLTFLIY